jgi:hypothetical protein
MHSRLIFLHRLQRLNPHVYFSKADPPIRCGGSARSRPFCCRSRWRKSQEKRAGDNAVARTKTDTGRRGEYPKALERTAVKELGNFAP